MIHSFTAFTGVISSMWAVLYSDLRQTDGSLIDVSPGFDFVLTHSLGRSQPCAQLYSLFHFWKEQDCTGAVNLLLCPHTQLVPQQGGHWHLQGTKSRGVSTTAGLSPLAPRRAEQSWAELTRAELCRAQLSWADICHICHVCTACSARRLGQSWHLY